MSLAAPARVWDKVGVDIFTFRDQDYLITTDYLSGYFEIDRLPSKRIADVIYCLKQQMARHGVPTILVSDNSPFGAKEFRAFAERYEFSHVTSSPRYPQSNGRAERSVQIARRLMTKAVESQADPFLALLAWRNTPSEQLSASPAQLMFGRRTRTLLPSTPQLLASPGAAAAQEALFAAKRRQAEYYDVGTKERQQLSVGETVRVKFDDRPDWWKAEISRILPHRSYEVEFDDGTRRRRTSRHVRFSAEPPLERRFEPAAPPCDDRPTPTPSSTSSPPSGQPSARKVKNSQRSPLAASRLLARAGRSSSQLVIVTNCTALITCLFLCFRILFGWESEPRD